MSAGSRVRDLLAQVVGEPELEVTDETPLAEIPNWDSLAHVNALFALEEGFGIVLAPEEFEPTTRIGELERLVGERARG